MHIGIMPESLRQAGPPHFQEFFPAPGAQNPALFFQQGMQGCLDGVPDPAHGLTGVAMGSADRFIHDPVNHAEFQ